LNLGICYERRFERLRDPADIDRAVDYARRPVDLIIPGGPTIDGVDEEEENEEEDEDEEDDIHEGNPTERSLYLETLAMRSGGDSKSLTVCEISKKQSTTDVLLPN
jgi:hypothetical protein